MACRSEKDLAADEDDEDGHASESHDHDGTFTLYVSVLGAIFSVIVVAQILRGTEMFPVAMDKMPP